VHPQRLSENRSPFLLVANTPNDPEGSPEPSNRRRGEHLIRPIDVLVVEDSPALRRTVATVLANDGYEVLSAADGLDALRVLENCDPKLLLLDLQLPRMEGKELVQEIRHRRISIRIIIMTGTQDARRAARELRADGYLSKPFELDEVLALAEQYCPRAA
jgi:DNA-binding response OmpR family regulator